MPLLAMPITRSPGTISRPTRMRSSATVPIAAPTRSKPLTMSGNAVEHSGIGAVDRDVIDHRNGPRADAQKVVDVHRDAIDADRVVFSHQLRDYRLRTDAIGAQREPDAADIDDIGEIADRQLHDAEAALGPGRGDTRDDVAQA